MTIADHEASAYVLLTDTALGVIGDALGPILDDLGGVLDTSSATGTNLGAFWGVTSATPLARSSLTSRMTAAS